METSPQTRYCVSCGRAIAWDANVCPYCGHDYRMPAMGYGQRPAPISEGMKILFYILSFLIWIAGLVIGIIYYSKDDPESKHVGKMALIFMVLGIVFWAVIGVLIWAIVLVGIGGSA